MAVTRSATTVWIPVLMPLAAPSTSASTQPVDKMEQPSTNSENIQALQRLICRLLRAIHSPAARFAKAQAAWLAQTGWAADELQSDTTILKYAVGLPVLPTGEIAIHTSGGIAGSDSTSPAPSDADHVAG